MPKKVPSDPSPRQRSRSFPVAGPLLRSLRAGRGWTQEQAAAKAGLSSRLIVKAEAGGAIEVQSIAILARLYSSPQTVLTTSDLLAPSPSQPPSQPLESLSQHGEAAGTPTPQSPSLAAALVRDWFEHLWNQRRLAVIDELAAPEIELHADGRQFRGHRSLRRRAAKVYAAFSDLGMTIDYLTVRDDLVICRWRLAMTNSGPWLGLPAMGKRTVVHGSTWLRIEDGLLRECWDYWGWRQP